MHNRLITRDVQFSAFDVEFHSGDSLGVQFFRTTEHLETDFEIEDGIVLPIGSQYSWTRHQLRLNLADQRRSSSFTRRTGATTGRWA